MGKYVAKSAVYVSSVEIEQVVSFNYLGAVVTSYARCKKEIRRRISLAKDAYSRMQYIFKYQKLSLGSE